MARVVVDVVEQRSGSGLGTAEKDLRRLGGAAEQADRKAAGAGGGFSKLGGLLKAGVAGAAVAAGLALGKLAGDAVNAASDLQQSLGGAQAIFGKDADKIIQKSNEAADNLGLSKSSYLELSTVLGAGLKNQGLTDFAGKTQKVIGLGADLSAQFGGSTKDAVEAIGSLMRGEADPIERYGVSINQTAVNAELAARGQDKLTGAAAKQAGAQARLDLLFKQTAASQGTFAKESDTLAGQQARLSANTENLKAKLGGALLPALTSITGALSRTVSGQGRLAAIGKTYAAFVVGVYKPILTQIKTSFGQVYAALVKAVGGTGNMARIGRTLGQVLRITASIVSGIVVGGIRILTSVIIGAIRIGAQMARNFQALGGAGSAAAGRVRTLVAAIKSSPAGQIFSQVADKIRGVGRAIGSVPDRIRSIGKAISGVGQGVFSAVAGAISSISGAARAAIGWLRDLAGAIANTPIGRAASAIGGLLRSTDVYGQPGTGSIATRIVVPVPPPQVNVTVDGYSLRAAIRAEVRAAVATMSTSRRLP